MQMHNRVMRKIGYCILILLYCTCSAEPDRDVEGFQKDRDTIVQLDTASKKLEAADSFHLRQKNEKGWLVDLNICKSSNTEDTTAKPNDVYAPCEFGGIYTDEKGASFHIEQIKQSGFMVQVDIADTGLLPQGFSTIRWDKQTFEQTLRNAALEDYVCICETDDNRLHTCEAGELTVTFKTDVDRYLIYHKGSRDQVMRIYTNIHKGEVHFMNKIRSMYHKEVL